MITALTTLRPRGERGFALIITLLVTAIIVSVLAEIVFSVHMDTMSTASFIDYQDASFLARDGLSLAKNFSLDVNDAGYTYIDDKNGQRVFKNIDDKGSSLTIKLSDESGLLSLNAIVYKNGEINKVYYDMYVRLLKELDLPASLAETLADWIDSNDSARKDGAENNDYYLRLSRPYLSKGGPLTSLEELYLVKGYGKEELKELSKFVTVYTDGKVNINTAPREVLRALNTDITDEMARNVVSYRKGTPFRETSEIRKVSGFEQVGFNLQNDIIVKSDLFRALITARRGKAKSVAEAVFRNGDKDGVTYYYRQR